MCVSHLMSISHVHYLFESTSHLIIFHIVCVSHIMGILHLSHTLCILYVCLILIYHCEKYISYLK